MYKTIKLGKIRTSKIELIDLLKSWIAISLAFTIASTGLNFNINFLILMLISAFTVGIGFLLHEMAHKFVAQHYNCTAEFRSFDQMLIFAIVLSFIGFLFAAPGAVMISGRITRKENGIISAAGPLTNFALALVFLGLAYFSPVLIGAIGNIWVRGFQINLWLGLFNMIPFGNFDGIKIFRWNPSLWIGMVAFGVYFLFFF
jgi:Zn-dependent protease